MLCAWESDLPRRLAIQKRRLKLLEPLDELNEKAYTQIVRQGLFDRGSISAEILEIKQTMHAHEPPPRRAKRLAPLVQAVVAAYRDFIKRFERKDEEGGGLPDRVEEEAEVLRVWYCYAPNQLSVRATSSQLHLTLGVGSRLGTSLNLLQTFILYAAKRCICWASWFSVA